MKLKATPRLRAVVVAAIAVLAAGRASSQAPSSPSIDDLINLKRVGNPAISPDGQHVAYTVRETN